MPPASSRSRSYSRSHSATSHASSASPAPRRKRCKANASTSTSPTTRGLTGSHHRASTRHTTVYDAVAGLVTSTGFLNSASHRIPTLRRDRPAHGARSVLHTEEVLFSRGAAPVTFEEDNVYRAHRHLVSSEAEAAGVRAHITSCATRPNRWGEREDVQEVERRKKRVKVGTLPEGDLCQAVHSFARDFYKVHGGTWDWRSLDETALLACGILLEETVRGQMGTTGWKAFVEADDEEVEDEGEHWEEETDKEMGCEKEQGGIEGEREEDNSWNKGDGESRRKKHKKRKIGSSKDDWGPDF